MLERSGAVATFQCETLHKPGRLSSTFVLHVLPADLNVPLDKANSITDDTRIRAAIPTLKYLLDNGAKVLLTSHLVRWHGI